MAYLDLQNLYSKYQNEYIINNLNLQVEQGELLILLGSSGCGKTTLLKIITGLITPEKGKILIDNKNITNFLPQERLIGYVPQAQVLFPHMNVKENIGFGLQARKVPKEIIEKKIIEVVKLTQIEDLLLRFPSEISGGQKQRVALARAIVIEPRLLLLDEPLSSIDASGREALVLTIKRVQRKTRTTTIYVTHNQQEARLIADKVAIMYNGIIQQTGTMNQIDNQPKNIQIAQIMGQLNIWPVISQKNFENALILNTPLGDITLSTNKINKIKSISGICIPATAIAIEIKNDDLQKNHFNLLRKIGKIISKTQLKSKIYQIIVEIKGKTIEYVKVQTDQEDKFKNLNLNQSIELLINPQEIKLF